MRLGSHEINLVESRLHSLQEFKQADSRSLARDFTKFTDRRGALASVATTEDLSSQRSAKPKASLALSLVCAIQRSTSVARTKNSVITCHQLKIKVNEIARNLDVFLQVAPPLLAKSNDEFSPTNL